MFKLRRFLPCAALRPYIDTYYLVEVDCPPGATLEDMMLPELANIRFQLEGCWDVDMGDGFKSASPETLFGFTNAPYDVRLTGRSRLFGAGLKPLGWQAIMGGSAAPYSDTCKNLADLWGPYASVGRQSLAACATGEEMVQVMDALLLERLTAVPKTTRACISAFECIMTADDDAPMTRVDDLADQLNLSVRQVERWSRHLFGCSPKLLLRKHRFMTMLTQHGERLAGDDWLEAADESFYDQSHFIREYKRFTGRSPGQYARKPSELQKAVTKTLETVPDRKPGPLALKVDFVPKAASTAA
ncbi:MAG: helix-turn-helix domain-containing protein [Pseudomonadota bacterium]